jgi:hypothetical protein
VSVRSVEFLPPVDVADPVLDELLRQHRQPESEGRGEDGEDEAPFDVQVARPRVLSIERLCRTAGHPPSPDVEARRVDRFLVVHAMTAFHRAARRPSAIWGMGYEVALGEGDIETLGVEPGTRLVDVGRVTQNVTLGLNLDGGLGVPSVAASGIPLGDSLPSARIFASTDQTFSLAIELRLQLLAVQAGVVGAGGARWNLYRQDKSLDDQQTLVQTIGVPRDGRSRSTAKIKTWVRSAGFLGLGSKVWIAAEPVEFPIDLR